MNIISTEFLIFVVILLIVYYLLPRKYQNICLLIGSYIFYASWSWYFAFILFGVTTLNFLAGIYFEKKTDNRAWIGTVIGLNIFSLVMYKFLNNRYAFQLVFQNIPSATLFQDWIMKALLPIGFSFYILQAISYLVDVSQNRLHASRNFVDFSLYMAYFPRLLSGPIERAKIFLPKLISTRIVDNQMVGKAVTLILVGLFRKVVIADLLNGFLQSEYLIKESGGLVGLSSLLAFTFYLYNDFSGYTSIVRGVSCLFGIELSPNFMQPFFSRSFSEFWTRWHISLSEWLRDYIFFPLSRRLLLINNNQRNPLNTYLPPLITMLVSGLWHGFNPAMVFWGGLHGIFLVLERFILIRWPGLRPTEGPKWKQITSGVVIFFMVTAAWVPFKIGGLREAFNFWSGLASNTIEAIQPSVLLWIIVLCLASLILDFIQYHKKDEVIFLKWKLFPKAAMTTLAIICMIVVSFWNMNIPSQVFVYQGF